ncbi:alpha-L-fucosidase [Kriegella aquimaris]|uniref:alpha-L-fucosidase n=1 Tax=Kriegella aquimaris TaxID=192904 RepID=A0A1G9XVQ3_9FLAO|nr:alpha-L-fucosidase [Kriegella aquimaris]SDN00909.1 Alpha-L-fucosidase [Kriegella aquimaris]
MSFNQRISIVNVYGFLKVWTSCLGRGKSRFLNLSNIRANNVNPLVFAVFVMFFLANHSFGQSQVRIACVGNSITYGARIENREVNSYPAQLGSILGDGYDVQNFGVSGTTMLRKGNLPYWKTEAYQKALDSRPDWVFIKLGTNDTKPVNRVFLDEYVQDYKDLIASFKNLPSKPRVVLLLPVPVFSNDTTGITAQIVREKLLPMVREVAYETNSEILNLYNLLIESPELFPDKVHPSAAGATVIARRVSELVKMKFVEPVDFSNYLPKDAAGFNFHGFQGHDFMFRGHNAKIVVPKNVAVGKPWIWRSRYWGHEPQVEIALLERGFHVVYCDVYESFLNKEGLLIWDGFYQLLTKAGLSTKSVMEGMSRGGVYIYRWAAFHPDRVSAVYGDAPMLDLKLYSKGTEHDFPKKWANFKTVFNFNTEEALAFKGNPLDLTEKIANGGFPMLHVVGDADEVVPVSEHTALFEQKIKDAGGLINVIHKPGIGHHPHSLQNPKPIVDFVLRATDYLVTQRMIPLPSGPQAHWQKNERLMFIHFAPNTWTGLSQDDNSLSMDRIDPSQLDTDQWCKVAKSWGATMIVFVAKHSGGFCWWQTNTTDYSVKNIPWKDGKGDLLEELSRSSDKYGLELGVYIYPGDKTWGAGLGSGGRTEDPGKQESYNKVFRQQLTEVLSKYKPMKEVWFDGSCVIDIADILEEHASDAVIFQGPQATIRWVGNERGIAPYPNWYTLDNADLATGQATALSSDPEGEAYAPVEVDVPFLMNDRSYRWFWAPNTDNILLSVTDLMDIYKKSVGRGSMLLLNATPDTTGLIPKSHVQRYKAFGKEIARRFDKSIASVSGEGNVLEIDLKKMVDINSVILQEDIFKGQRIRKFAIEGYSNGLWKTIKEGTSVGSKRIEEFPPVSVSKVRLRMTEAIATPSIVNFAIFNIEKLPEDTKRELNNETITLGGWDNRTYTEEWEDLSFDLTPYLINKVGQFELNFRYITHDRGYEKKESGGYGLAFKDWKIEINNVPNSEAIQMKGDKIFLINNSQHFSDTEEVKVEFKTQIRSKPGGSVGTIELKMIDFE